MQSRFQERQKMTTVKVCYSTYIFNYVELYTQIGKILMVKSDFHSGYKDNDKFTYFPQSYRCGIKQDSVEKKVSP